MLNKLSAFIRRYELVQRGDTVICALSGGADSVALTFALYLLRDKLGISLAAAHFNHHLRGEESLRDADFVREFCHRYDIPLYTGEGHVVPGKKGLEAAARDARYAFLRSLPGKIATAHTADDNTETVLMHMIRGTGLKGLGGIAPVSGNVIRPMLSVTRREVEDFCRQWCLSYVTDSTNAADQFLRNRVRHGILPLLRQENPAFAENTSAMALRLRKDEAFLSGAAPDTLQVEALRSLPPALKARALEAILKRFGVREPEAEHIALLESLVNSENPSARAQFPGGITLCRQYDRLGLWEDASPLPEQVLTCPGEVELPEIGLRVRCVPAKEIQNTANVFTVCPEGRILLRSRQTGDSIRLSGGTKSLKKLFIDRKIPARDRCRIPVFADEQGILGVYTVGTDVTRAAQGLPAVQITVTEIK